MTQRTPSLSRTELRRLHRLAKHAGTTPAKVLKAVLRDGFDYTEWFVRRVKEGDADRKAGRVLSTKDVLAQIERQRASRGRLETAHLTRSRANLRRLRGAHTQIEAEIGRRKRGA